MSHKLAKVIKYNKRNYQASKSASSIKAHGRRLGDRLLHYGGITNVATGTFTGLMKSFSQRVLPALHLPTSLKARRGPLQSCHPLMFALSLAVLALPAFVSSTVSATPYSMTVSIDDSVLDMNVSPSQAGAFSKSSNSTVSVSTTNASGYTLSIASSNRNDGKLVDSTNNDTDTNYLSSITSATTEEQFKALDGTAYNNMWGYLPSKWDGQANTSYLPSPTTTGDVLDHTTAANTTANTYTLSIGARVDATQKIGSYTNTYVVLATANGTPYTITYIDDTIAGFPTDESATATSDIVSISDKIPTRPGYTFLGWCTGTNTTSNVVHHADGIDTCSHGANGAPEYTAGDTWTIDQTISNNNLYLYAMWGGNYTIEALATNGNTLYMQDFNAMSADKKGKIVASMVEGQAYTVKDTRHATNEAEPEYKIAKLKDGNVWMLDNLRLGSNDKSIALTPGDTNIVTSYTLPQGVTSGFGSYTDARINAAYKDSTDVISYGQGSGKIGVYYNYCAASAGTYCYTSGESLDIPNTIVDSPYDVCPSGWRIPTGGPASEYQILYDQYNTTQTATDTSSLQYNLSTTLAGLFDDSAQGYFGSFGHFWASSFVENNNSQMYSLIITSTRVYAQRAYGRSYGFSIRCLLK